MYFSLRAAATTTARLAARNAVRPIPAAATTTTTPIMRPFHTPFPQRGDSPLTQPPSAQSTVSSINEKETEYYSEPFTTHTGNRTYVVSEPDASTKHYGVPAGAYPTSAPYVNFVPAESAPDTHDAQVSSTSSTLLAHEHTLKTVAKHPGGVGVSAAIRFSEAPGEMGLRGGSHGGEGIVDAAGTVPPEIPGEERNPPPDGDAAELFSKMGVSEAWRYRK